MRNHESVHHFQWPRKDYLSHHERKLRTLIVAPTRWLLHRELHLAMLEPPKIDIGLTLHLIDRFDEKQPAKEDAALYAVDWLNQQRSPQALELSEHFVKQLGYLEIGYGRVC